MNRTQKMISAVAGLLLTALLLFPPWQQTSLHETDYREDIGRGFVLHAPHTVSVECYFVGCKVAPASYFHAVLYFRLYIEQIATVLCITSALLWMFRTQSSGVQANLESRGARLRFSMLIALAVPFGDYTLASLLADIPRQIINRNELWLIPVLFLPVLFAGYSGAIYLILTAILWLRRRRQKPAVVAII